MHRNTVSVPRARSCPCRISTGEAPSGCQSTLLRISICRRSRTSSSLGSLAHCSLKHRYYRGYLQSRKEEIRSNKFGEQTYLLNIMQALGPHRPQASHVRLVPAPYLASLSHHRYRSRGLGTTHDYYQPQVDQSRGMFHTLAPPPSAKTFAGHQRALRGCLSTQQSRERRQSPALWQDSTMPWFS